VDILDCPVIQNFEKKKAKYSSKSKKDGFIYLLLPVIVGQPDLSGVYRDCEMDGIMLRKVIRIQNNFFQNLK